LQGAPAAPGGALLVVGDPRRGRAVVEGADPVEGGLGGVGVLVRLGEGVDHRRGQYCRSGSGGVHRSQIPEQVSSAPGVMGLDQVGVAAVAVAHDRAGVSGQHLSGVDSGLAASTGVHRGQELGARHMHVFEAAVGAGWGLIDV